MAPSPLRNTTVKANRLILLSLLAVLAAACTQTTKPAEATFTITLEPAVLDLRVTDVGEARIVVNRSGGFDEPIAVTIEGDATGLDADPLTITTSEGTLRFQVTDSAKEGTSFPTVKAVGGSVTRSETLTLHIGKAVALATEVVVEDNNGSSQVRQGSGEVTLAVTGSNLERVTDVKVGDLATNVLTRTEQRLELSAAVPHGATIGQKDLLLTAEGGDTVFEGALIVTAVTAGPAGDDDAGAGTADDPYRTLTYALTQAQAGDTVGLLDGTYSAASGETWPTLVGGVLDPGPNVPAGVLVQGQSTARVVLKGPGSAGSPFAVGLAFADAGGAGGLTAESFAAGFFVTAGDVVLQAVRAHGNVVGLAVDGGQVIAHSSEFSANGEDGVLVVGGAHVELEGGSAHDNAAAGVRLGDGAPTLQTDGFEAYGNLTGVAVAGDASAVLEDSEFHHNSDHGLEVIESGSAEARGSELHANTQAGLWFGGKSLIVRDTTVHDNGEFGVYVEGEPERADFGNFSEAGNNLLYDNGPGTADQLLDVRADRPGLGDPEVFTMSATSLAGETPAPDIYPPDGMWPYFNSPHFSILGENNFIHVY